MKFLLSTTAISTLLLTTTAFAHLGQDTQETEAKDVEKYVEDSAEQPITPTDLDQDALDRVEDAETLNKIVLDATTEAGDGKVIVETGDDERKQVVADASTTPDRPSQNETDDGDDNELNETQRRQQAAINAILAKTSDETRTASSDVDSDENNAEPEKVATNAEVKEDETYEKQAKPEAESPMMSAAMQDKHRKMMTEQAEMRSDDVFITTTSVRLRPDAINANRLLGEDIDSIEGDDDIAELDDLIIDKDGRVTEVVLKAGGVLGLGEKTYVSTFDKLTFRPEEDDDEDELDIIMNADKDTIKALAPWSRDEFAIGENGMTLLTELKGAELRIPGVDEEVEVQDVIISPSGLVRSLIIERDGQRFALDYDRISVSEGSADDDAGYTVNLTPAELAALPVLIVDIEDNPLRRVGTAIENAAENTAEKAKKATRALRSEGREAAEEADEAAGNAKQELEETGNEVEAEAEETWNETKEAAEAAEEEAEETTNEAADAVEDAGDDFKEGVEEATDGRPNR
ncbi:PRC-barrel domain-containing protein [Parvularcula lutaonensis]|uniref:PRC-barrel domain-containing protein n=1 Tax=Parvularcula lutaonensis TaxID=491923 RepID=A0ABV7M7Z4_9PROT|nr:PRC-barrel domain-containing protein [Parvularcula lutaonensis]GGY43482.1 hypothetical protein GCM10007148_10320 [Parvularcula lutaonensis]